jgi:hypothetical protein
MIVQSNGAVLRTPIQNWHFRVRRDTNQRWCRMEFHRLVKTGFKPSDRPIHDDDRGALSDPDHTAEPFLEDDDIPGAKPEWTRVGPPDQAEKVGLLAISYRLVFHRASS